MLREWLRTPVYETIKEGPSHEPFFKIAVILDNIKYYSVPGFYNRKAAEQSAAEVALLELVKSVDTLFGISQPVVIILDEQGIICSLRVEPCTFLARFIDFLVSSA
ncbi:double-stranded RNA-binding 1-like [Olea europaea subsp. europaea]|uniref:Double-stranded RNA-binding 1-like n=1 Tax=Olea europaea subsp. europaea TaxID=158383 RepID=A0A8S0Q7V0_OLEEU|nr:double-stranded RNA-binding 1-like [Olea europaea subsp. europaea]